jgi:hypothetical protein
VAIAGKFSLSQKSSTSMLNRHDDVLSYAYVPSSFCFRMDDNIKVLTFLYIFLMMAWLFILLIRCWDVLFDPERREE